MAAQKSSHKREAKAHVSVGEKDFSQLPDVFMSYLKLTSVSCTLEMNPSQLRIKSSERCHSQIVPLSEVWQTSPNIKRNWFENDLWFILVIFSDWLLENHNLIYLYVPPKIVFLLSKHKWWEILKSMFWISGHFPGLISYAVFWNANYQSSFAFIFPLLAHFLVNIKRPVMRLSCCLDKQIAQRGVKWHVRSPWASCQIWNQFFSSLLAFQFWGRFRGVLFRGHFYKEQLFSKTVCILAWLRTIFSTTDLRIDRQLDACNLSSFKTH